MDCGECCLVPPLVSEKNPVVKYCEEPPACAPCLPRCTKVVYCRPCSPVAPRRQERHDYDCCHHDHDCCHYEHRDQRRNDRNEYRKKDYDDYRPRDQQYYCRHDHHDCCHHDHCCHDHHSLTCASQPKECYIPVCKPIRTKYVIPCYRYEDGRILQQERYVPTRHGTLPKSAYRRNGMQDQVHGYRGAQRYLCACDGIDGCYVHTLVEPMRRLYPHITQEVLPVKRKKDKK